MRKQFPKFKCHICSKLFDIKRNGEEKIVKTGVMFTKTGPDTTRALIIYKTYCGHCYLDAAGYEDKTDVGSAK